MVSCIWRCQILTGWGPFWESDLVSTICIGDPAAQVLNMPRAEQGLCGFYFSVKEKGTRNECKSRAVGICLITRNHFKGKSSISMEKFTPFFIQLREWKRNGSICYNLQVRPEDELCHFSCNNLCCWLTAWNFLLDWVGNYSQKQPIRLCRARNSGLLGSAKNRDRGGGWMHFCIRTVRRSALLQCVSYLISSSPLASLVAH